MPKGKGYGGVDSRGNPTKADMTQAHVPKGAPDMKTMVPKGTTTHTVPKEPLGGAERLKTNAGY